MTSKPDSLAERLRDAIMDFAWADLPDDALIPAVPLLREAAIALSARAPVAEPVAWRVPVNNDGRIMNLYTECLPYTPPDHVKVRGEPEPLYPSAQPPAKALAVPEARLFIERLRATSYLHHRGPDYEPLPVPPSALALEVAAFLEAALEASAAPEPASPGVKASDWRGEMDKLWRMFVVQCESIEERASSSVPETGNEHERGFYNGERSAAKDIRRSVQHPRYNPADFPLYADQAQEGRS